MDFSFQVKTQFLSLADLTCRPHFWSISGFCDIRNTIFDHTSHAINASAPFVYQLASLAFPLHTSLSFSQNFLQLPLYHFNPLSSPFRSLFIIFHWFWAWLLPTLVYVQTSHLLHFFCHTLYFANCTVYSPSPLLIPSQFSALFRTILRSLLYLPPFPLSLLESTHSSNSLNQFLAFPTIRHRHIYLRLQSSAKPAVSWLTSARRGGNSYEFNLPAPQYNVSYVFSC